MRENRREISRLLLKTALATLLAVAVLCLAIFAVPKLRERQLQASLAAGDTESARRIAMALEEEEQAEILQQCSYIDAERLAGEGRWQEASAAFTEAGSFSDAADRRKDCDYAYALQLEQAEDWDAAEAMFQSLGAYGDAAEQLQACRYGKALSLLDSGEKIDAAGILDKLGEYRDAPELLLKTVKELTGISDDKQALAAFHGMSEADLELIDQLTERRAALPQGILDMGFAHTVGLQPDGTVAACGDNSYGQCDTAGWMEVTAVAAGAYHTVALRKDGTVVSTGQNTENQCDTSDWTDIVQVAASDWATFGLKKDGTVVSCGINDYSNIKDWTGMVSITAGSYGIAAQRSDGSLWFFPEMNNASVLESAVCLAINTGYAVAAQQNGTVLCTSYGSDNWNGIIGLSASGTAILGLRADGRVSSYFFRSADAVDLSSVTDAVFVCAAADRFAVVHADGRVSLFGTPAEGEEQLSAWNLKVA